MILPAMLLTSCGSGDGSSAKPAFVDTVKKQDEFSFSSNPLAYKNTHFDCAENTNFKTLYNIFAYDTNQVVMNPIVYLNALYSGSPILKRADSKFIDATIYGRELIDTYKLIFNEDNQVIGGTNVSGGTLGAPLILCNDQVIERESVQHIAADIISTLDMSFDALEVAGEGKKVKPISIFTHPIVSTVYEYYNEGSTDLAYSEEQVMTDNAFYYDSGLYFIPHSKEFKEYLGAKHVDYWEIPFVASHEYGHHIFASFFPKSQGQLNLKSKMKHTCFEGHKELNKKFKKQNIPEAFGQRQVSAQDVLSSFNEGFADLFAFFTLDKAKSSLEGIFGFDDEREVDSLFLANFTEKKFSKEIAGAFFSTSEYSRTSSLATFQDTHTIGAIVAARFNLILDNAGMNRVEKLQVILKWLERMDLNFSKNSEKDVEDYMFDCLKDFILVFNKANSQDMLSAEQLIEFQNAFPYYSDKF